MSGRLLGRIEGVALHMSRTIPTRFLARLYRSTRLLVVLYTVDQLSDPFFPGLDPFRGEEIVSSWRVLPDPAVS